MSAPAVAIRDDLAVVRFDRFDLDSYRLFLGAKALPESRVRYDWRADAYTLTTPARFAPLLGADVPRRAAADLPLAGHLFDYQRWAVKLALAAKRFALWCDTGLGKGPMGLEWGRQVQARTGGRVLFLMPLGIIPQYRAEAERFYGDALAPRQLRTRDDLIAWCRSGPEPFGISNYEKLDGGDIPEFRHLAGLVADESSMLKTGGGQRKWALIHSAKGIEYKLSCTATPAPNDAMEYASQAAFLEKLRSEGEILWTYFSRNKAGEWSVKPHARQAFYRFMASWSLYLRDPARFGFADILASLPAPEVIEERLPLTDEQRRLMQEVAVRHGAGLWADERLGVVPRTKLAQIARGFLYEREGKRQVARRVDAIKPRRVAEIVRSEVSHGRQVLVWTTFDAEGEILARLIHRAAGDVGILTGDMGDEERQKALDFFRSGDVACLISKPRLIGYGLNLQFVKSMVFSGFSDSFEQSYQAIRRAYRFGQTEAVRVFWPYVPELEGVVFDNIKAKEQRFLAEVAAQEGQYKAALAGQLAGAAA